MLQKKIFERIVALHHNQAEALQKVSDLLFINKSNAYRRLTNEIKLKPDEISTLVKHYNLSLDEIIHNKENQYLFVHSNQSVASDKIEVFFKPIFDQLEQVSKIPDYFIYFTGYEIPILHYSAYPELVYFKIFLWNHIKMRTDNKVMSFNLTSFDDKYRVLFKGIKDNFNKVPSVEIWDNRGIQIVVGYIKYAHNARLITFEETKLLIDLLKKAINDFEQKAMYGTKDLINKPKNFELYHSEFINDSHMYISNSELVGRANFINLLFDSPNQIVSFDPQIVAKMKARFLLLKNQSQKVSETGEVARRKLFAHYRKNIRQLERELKPF